MLQKYKTIIWDWNGTLLDDVSLCVSAINPILASHSSRPLNIDSYRNIFSFPIENYYQKIGIDFSKESFESITQKFISTYYEGVNDCVLHPYAIKTLQKISKLQKSQYILTAGHKESVIRLLKDFDIEHFFKQVEGLDNHKAESKIERGRNLLQKNHLHTKDCVLIGDTIHDYEVAQSLAIDCILIANGHQSKSVLSKGVDPNTPVIDNISELTRPPH